MGNDPVAAQLAACGRVVELGRKLLAEKSPTFQALLKEIGKGKRPAILHNLGGSAFAAVVASLSERLERPILVLTAGMERAEQLVDDLEFFGCPRALHYPKWEVLPYDEEDLSLEVTSKHLDVFDALALARDPSKAPNADDARHLVITAPIDALMQRVLPADILEGFTLRINWGDRLDLAKLAQDFDRSGYERVGLVEARGEFSIRGSIIDIYPPNTEDPIRLDLFGDEIESIRHFEVATQRSTRDLGTGITLSIPAARLKHHIEDHVKEGGNLATLFDLLPKDTLILLDSPERYEEVCTYFESAVRRQYEEVLHSRSQLGPPENLVLSIPDLQACINAFRRIENTTLPVNTDEKSTARFIFESAGFAPDGDGLDHWISAIRRRQHEDYLVIVVCDNDGQAQRFDEVMREFELSARVVLDTDAADKVTLREAVEGYRDILLVVGALQEGFAFRDARVAFVTDREIFGRYRRRHVYRKIYKGRPVTTSGDIQRGDYIIHVDHGIGRYLGMRQQTIDSRVMDLLELEYCDGDKLLVPVEKIRYVQRYASSQADPPMLDKLGSNKWMKRRRASLKLVEEMAQQLLVLYAKREVAERKPFVLDGIAQTEFEASFPYQETPDQAKAILDVKRDMERYQPMDRLLCGDVGYGKTEVAIRAAFKCVQDGRQAAVLVPTTILALQHFRTFKERFAEHGVRVELMSRFQKSREIAKSKAALATGELQVVVGTHKLLGSDIKFKDLGLLVVDEEQRFGVKAKERLKELRAEVDILTMTATPIPRTLHMALAGLRDLSVITTPPPDRHPIKTRIIHWEEEQIAEAILRELNRGGQVFFIHNRVHNIEEIAKQVQKIVPHARIGVAHGQMKEEDLEDHMIRFIQRDYDILISTTIVESGIDIPNANTIIVNRADAFGLAQLYQLRGRVGREKRRAYAYLIVPQGQAITETAVRRLAAIEEFTELGSGFNIAMRDMEIRGAGNLLGKEQHGIVHEIGFELYCDMLQDAVARLKGEERHDQHDVEIKWPVSSYIPAPYIPIETQRVNFYKRLSLMSRQPEVEDLAAELRDRYGDPPEPVLTLLELTRLRLAAARMRVSLIEASSTGARISLSRPMEDKQRDLWRKAGKDTAGVSSSVAESTNVASVKLQAGDALTRIKALREYFNALYYLQEKEAKALEEPQAVG
jgi:transcription-repair coupling factor (superfamily II helicase)